MKGRRLMQVRGSDWFTVFIILMLGLAIYMASSWPLRASIIVLVLGSAGLFMAVVQLALDIRARHLKISPRSTPRLAMELPATESKNPKEDLLGTLEIWVWLLGLFLAIYVIGLRIALPFFVLSYARLYGASWRLSVFLAALIGAFMFGIYDNIMHVYWPDSILGNLLDLND